MITVTCKILDTERYLYSASAYFDGYYKPEWMDDPIVKQMVKDIDKSKVVSRNVIESPVLGQIPPQWLSGGVKGLILILKETYKREYSSQIFGDNCVPWLVKLGEMVDYTLMIEHPIMFIGDGKVSAKGAEGEKLLTRKDIAYYYFAHKHEREANNEYYSSEY